MSAKPTMSCTNFFRGHVGRSLMYDRMEKPLAHVLTDGVTFRDCATWLLKRTSEKREGRG